MSNDSFNGFDPKSKLIPVPSALLSSLLIEIDERAEFACALRFFWFLSQANGVPKKVKVEDLLNDHVLLKTLGSSEAIREGISKAVLRKIILEADGWLVVNTGQNLHSSDDIRVDQTHFADAPYDRPNIYKLYEENIGLITPIIAEELMTAEEEFPAAWIEMAIHEAVKNNVRNWRYTLAVLNSWKTKGKASNSGELGRHPEKVTAAEYIQRRRNS
tara:strand:- start:1936 stop:2583 length:648 start_codon:yes stop_codon:yes gene_type:complete